MTERLDRRIQSRRLRRIRLQHRDDHQHPRSGKHDTFGRVAGDPDRRDAGATTDAQVFEELFGYALVDVITADSDETQRHHDENRLAPAGLHHLRTPAGVLLTALLT